MVNLTLTPHRGNGARTFPSTGYLGFSPVTLAGVVRVKIQEDNKAIEASSLVVRVRCYETVGGGTSPATASTNQQGSSGALMSSSSAIPTTTNPIASTSSSFSSSSSASPTNVPFSGSHSGTSGPSTSASASASANASVGASGNQHSIHSSSSASSPSKGKVLYEKNLTLWLPPAPTNASTSTASTASSSPSPSTSACSSSSCSRSNSVERGCSTGSQSHLYPPSQPPRRENCLARYGTLGEYQKAFRIVIPPEAVNEGAKSTMIFKNWRVWWAIEAVIAHKNLGVLGDRIVRSHQVSLISYAPVPTPSIPLSWLSPPCTSESEASIPTSSASRTTSTTHPALSYSITSSTSAYGSSDPVSFSVKLTKRSHMSETPRKVVLELRREILFTAADSPLASSHHTFESPQQHSSSALSSTSSSASASAAVAAVAAATATGSNKRSTYFGNRHSRGVSQPISLGSSGGSNQHHGSAGGGGSHLVSSLGSSANKHKTESTEALISPPLLSTASTISTNSVMPATPPLNVPTPVEYQEAQTESYFGLFKNGHSTASPKTSSQSHGHGHAHGHFALPRQIHFAPNPTSAAPIALNLPSAQIYLSKRKREDVSLATFEADCLFTSSTWSGTITGNMPKAKSLYHYALGETCNTASACSRFYIVARIQYKSKQTFLELPPQNLVFFTVSEEERRKAIDLLPKTLATQKAEAKLFDGVEVREKRSSAGATHPSRTTHSQPFLQVAPNATTSAGPSSTSSSRSRSHQKPLEARRDRISKSVSPKVSGSMSASSSPSEEEELLDNDTEARAKRANGDQHRSSNVRRRSEQSDAYEVSRTRKRFGSTPDLSPVVGSPYIDAVSPSLSLISSSTTRPRTAGSRRPNTGNSSIRSGVFTGWSTRPRSAAGLEPSSSSVGSIPSGRFAHIATFEDLCRLSNPASATTTTTTTASRRPSNPSVVGDEESSDAPSAAHSAPVAMLESRSSRSSSLASSSNSSPEAHVRYEAKENLTPLAAEYTTISSTTVNGLFADFNGFSLKSGAPVGRSTVPVIKEELVPPKPGAHVANSKIQAVSRHPENVAANGVISSKRKSVDLLADTRFPPGKMGSESRTSSNTSASAESTFSSGSSHDRSSNSNSNSNSNSGVSMREITLAMPPASVGMNPNASSNGTLLVPPVSMRGTGPNGSGRSSPMSKASSHTSMLESAAAAAASASAGKGEDARRRSRSGGMASAFSFFRRSSTKT